MTKMRPASWLLIWVLLGSGCYAEMAGFVVDAETGAPIEGAVVLVEWTKTKGIPGMTVTETYEVIERVSDKEGKVEISGVLDPSVNPPGVTVYKAGYVAWNNEFIFPDYGKRKDFKWGNHYVFRLEKFKPEYTHTDHLSFIRGAVHSSSASERKMIMKNSYEWETRKASEERERIENGKQKKSK